MTDDTGNDPRDDGVNPRRKEERRKQQVPFEGDDRRNGQRRSGEDRRKSERRSGLDRRSDNPDDDASDKA
ncbi:MAG: hypothetical protein AAF494_05635 [Pseudomonadota bacterium]